MHQDLFDLGIINNHNKTNALVGIDTIETHRQPMQQCGNNVANFVQMNERIVDQL